MLYPKKYKIDKENKIIEYLNYIKDSIIILLSAFSSYNSFILFLEQTFHF